MIADAVLEAGVAEIVRQARGLAEELAAEDIAKAKELRAVATAIAVDLATGRVTVAEAKEAGESLILAARSIAVGNALDVLAARREAAAGAASVVLRMLIAAV
jgi:hypothetical protein